MYVPKYFAAHELVPPHIFQQRGAKSFELLDDRVLITLDALREKFGPLVVNNYHSGGDRKWSGLRTQGFYGSAAAYEASLSQHKFGRAADCLPSKTTAEAMRQYVLAHPDEFPHITFLETDVSWFHFDVRNCKPITTWSPR